jgi:hypothetical protein
MEGLQFEKQFMKEVGCFTNAADGVPGDLVMAALIARREQKFDLLKQIHERKIRPTVCISDDDQFCIEPQNGKEVLQFGAFR